MLLIQLKLDLLFQQVLTNKYIYLILFVHKTLICQLGSLHAQTNTAPNPQENVVEEFNMKNAPVVEPKRKEPVVMLNRLSAEVSIV